MARFYQGFRRDAHPMAIMVAAVGALAAFYHDSTDINDPRQRMIASMRMIAKVPTLAAMAFKYTIGQPFMYPKNSLSFAENFLHMCFAGLRGIADQPGAGYALEKIVILTPTTSERLDPACVSPGSSRESVARIAAGIAAWGPCAGVRQREALRC